MTVTPLIKAMITLGFPSTPGSCVGTGVAVTTGTTTGTNTVGTADVT